MRWTCAAGLVLAGLWPAASAVAAAPPTEPPPGEVRFTLEGTYSPLTARPDCWFFITAACAVRWTGTGRISGDLDGKLAYSRRGFTAPSSSNFFRYDVDDRFTGTVAGCGEGALGIAGSGWWRKTDPARAEFRSDELILVTGASEGLETVLGSFEGTSAMGLDGTLRAEYAGRLACPSKAVVESAPRRPALRVGRRCTPRKQRLYRRHGLTCRKRAGGRHRLARARSGP